MTHKVLFNRLVYITSSVHYNDVSWTYQITDNSTVSSASCSGFQPRKHQSSALLPLCEGNPSVTGEFLPQMQVIWEAFSCRNDEPVTFGNTIVEILGKQSVNKLTGEINMIKCVVSYLILWWPWWHDILIYFSSDWGFGKKYMNNSLYHTNVLFTTDILLYSVWKCWCKWDTLSVLSKCTNFFPKFISFYQQSKVWCC